MERLLKVWVGLGHIVDALSYHESLVLLPLVTTFAFLALVAHRGYWTKTWGRVLWGLVLIALLALCYRMGITAVIAAVSDTNLKGNFALIYLLSVPQFFAAWILTCFFRMKTK